MYKHYTHTKLRHMVCIGMCVSAFAFNDRSFNKGMYKEKKNRGIHNAELLLVIKKTYPYRYHDI